MKLGDLCSAPCFSCASTFEIPLPGCNKEQLKFDLERERDFYAVLLRNHDLSHASKLDPKIAVVGLSPAGNQIDEFLDEYRRTGDYAKASVAGAFAGLAPDIIKMFKGLGIADELELTFPQPDTLAFHPDIYVTSLVACASLTSDGKSSDFDPNKFDGTRRCIVDRFIAEILNPKFNKLSHVFVLGNKGWSAIGTIRDANGVTVLDRLRRHGKVLCRLPHPSGENGEYVKLASLSAEQMPSVNSYVTEMWTEYFLKGNPKQSQAQYKKKRASVWESVQAMREQFN